MTIVAVVALGIAGYWSTTPSGLHQEGRPLVRALDHALAHVGDLEFERLFTMARARASSPSVPVLMRAVRQKIDRSIMRHERRVSRRDSAPKQRGTRSRRGLRARCHSIRHAVVRKREHGSETSDGGSAEGDGRAKHARGARSLERNMIEIREETRDVLAKMDRAHSRTPGHRDDPSFRALGKKRNRGDDTQVSKMDR